MKMVLPHHHYKAFVCVYVRVGVCFFFGKGRGGGGGGGVEGRSCL